MDLEYTLIRSDRKTTAIRILKDGTVEVRAPKRLAKRVIDDFVREKQHWIAGHQQTIAERHAAADPRRILYGGQWYDIEPGDGNSIGFEGSRFVAPTDCSAEEIKLAMAEVMKKLAKKVLLPRAAQMAQTMCLQPDKWGVTSAKTKWASCSGVKHGTGKNINFSWRLMAAPPDVIDYVIIHELCHMTEMNHSSRFWALVEKHCPDWKTRRDKLPEIQHWVEAYYG